VAGLEGDWQWTNQRDSISITMGTPSSNLNKLGLTIDETLNWLATFRGRIGYDREDWLWYVTGGGAFGGITENDMLTVVAPTVGANFSHTLGGWTAGAGVEKAIAGHWTAKLEYLYVNLGAMTDTIVDAPGAVETIHQSVSDQIVRLGLNYRF
jgi:outer membrane immunogenic protein